MKPTIHWIPGPWPGRLGIAARPRGGDWLDDDVGAWRDEGVDLVVSLLEQHEIEQLELGGEATSTLAHGLQFRSEPIPDRGIPFSQGVIESLAASIGAELDAGRTVVVHCRQGIGRSPLVAAAVLILTGQAGEQALRTISDARGLRVPETDEQRKWIDDFALAHAR